MSDPHDFIPDHESSSPGEIAAHKLAEKNWGKSTFEPNKGCFTEHDSDGQLVKHVLRTSWGIGTNMMRYCDGEDCIDNGTPLFDEPFITCHECGRDCCEGCWVKHDAKEDCF